MNPYHLTFTRMTCLTMALLLTVGSATSSPRNFEENATPAAPKEDDPCSVGRSALAGALGGALLGAIIGGRNSAAKGAAVGAIGATLACLVINQNSKQTKTAEQVDREFVKAKGSLPPEPQVVTYSSNINATVAKRGQPVVVRSVVELVNGRVQPVQEVREELVIFDTRDTPVRSATKPLTVASAGRYENTFELSLPQSAPQGFYKMQTNLYVNNRLAASRELKTQIVWNGHEAVRVASK